MVPFSLLLYIIIVGVVFSGIAVLISILAKSMVLPKYIPGAILLILTVFFIVKARWFSEGMEGLGYIILAIITGGGCIISLMVPAALDLYKKFRK